MKTSFVSFVLILSALEAGAQDSRVEINTFPQSSNLLRSDEVYLRNNTTVDLFFWLSIENGPWIEFQIPKAKAARLREGSVDVAIATTVSQGDGSDGPPPLNSDSLVTGSRTDGSWFFRTVEGASRAEFCWARAARRWRLQVDDNICD